MKVIESRVFLSCCLLKSVSLSEDFGITLLTSSIGKQSTFVEHWQSVRHSIMLTHEWW